MPNAWFRMYSEFAHDPKVQTMPIAMQRHLIMLFCLRCEGKPLGKYSDDEISYFLQITPLELPQVKSLFLKKGFIDGTWEIVNWNKRQYISDSSTERVRQYRERLKQDETLPKQHETENVTAPDTDTDTEQKQKKKRLSAKDKPSTDERARFFKSDFEKAFLFINGVPAPWDAKEATNLKRWLAKNPTITRQQWQNILRNRKASPINQKSELSRWIAIALSWLDSIADEWGKPIQSNGNGGNHAAIPTGKTEGNVAVLKESLFGTKHQSTAHEDGLFSSGEDGENDSRTIHGVFTTVGPPSLPSGDGDSF